MHAKSRLTRIQVMNNDRSSPSPPMAPTLAPSRSVPLNLVDIAAQIQKADQVLGCVTTQKLRIIVEQIQALQQKARELLEQAQHSSDLHRVECRFQKRPGHVYHLYRRSEGSLYFSMLSPHDWRDHPPDTFAGSFRLEQDMSFTPVQDIARRDAQDDMLRQLLPPSENGQR